jgi:AcrR family transcriptional regulator
MATAVSPTRMTGAQRRQRILDVAAELFAARGYHSTSVAEIAAAAGITKPVLYDHFASKQQLFIELMEDIRDELTSRGAAAMHADADVETRVRAAVEAFFDYVEERPAAARVLLVTPRGEPELTEASALVQAQATAALTDLLVAEPALLPGARNRRRRIELITEFLKQGLHGLAEWWAEHPATPKHALVDAALDIAWSGLRSGLAA